MAPHKAAARRVVAWDTETALIRPALLAPPLVCITWQSPGEEAFIEAECDAKPIIEGWLRDSNTLLVGHNIAYDLAVVGAAYPDLLPSIFDAYAADRVTDTMLRQYLLDTAAGDYQGGVTSKGKRVRREYTLEALAERNANMVLQKDAWRLSYGEFLGLPLSAWPAKAREVQEKASSELASLLFDFHGRELPADVKKACESLSLMVDGDPNRCTTYPLDDARATLAVFQAQEKHATCLDDQYRQARAAFALHLSSAWGLRTDPEGVEALRLATQEELDELEEELREAGLIRANGTRDTKAAKARMIEVCRRDEKPIIRTDGHFAEGAECGGAVDCEEHVCLDGDACEASEDEILIDYARRTTLAKQLANDIPALARGIEYPVHTRYGFASTGRSTSSKPNIQNQSRRPGFREAFVPRPGKLYAECDFPGLELYAWAQCCVVWFGFSDLADALNAGIDPHTLLASKLLRIAYEEAVANRKRADVVVEQARDRAKPGNFGFLGGMGIPKFLTSTRKAMGRKAFDALGLDEKSAYEMKNVWKQTYRESELHFGRAAVICDTEGHQVESLFTKRFRGGTTYCATCNTPFQGLGADCAKEAAWRIAKAQYTDLTSPLYNTRTVAFVHDEFIIEVDEERGHEAAMELARVMVEGANVYLPDVPIPLSKMEPLLMRRWSKKAKPRFVDVGGERRLVPWM